MTPSPNGFVYFMETEDSQYVKIGFSRKVIRRLGELGTLMPIRLIGYFPACRQTERTLHRKFAADHKVGEWFKSTEQLRESIAMLELIKAPEPKPEPEYVGKSVKPNLCDVTLTADERSAIAAALGRLGGLKGGKARAENLTPEQLSKIGKKAGKVGGKARAAALTPEERRAIGRRAAAARWKDKQDGL